jgi:hypothetical protein
MRIFSLKPAGAVGPNLARPGVRRGIARAKESIMISVKTFTSEIKPFYTMRELDSLDQEVNRFIAGEGIKKLLSVSDTCTTDDSGATIGIIRVLAYER